MSRIEQAIKDALKERDLVVLNDDPFDMQVENTEDGEKFRCQLSPVAEGNDTSWEGFGNPIVEVHGQEYHLVRL